jgi:P-type E1-E2 ATPase
VLDGMREAGGFGVTGTVAGQAVALGRPDLLARLGVAAPAAPVHDGPIAGLALGGAFQGWLLFADRPRPESRAAVAELRAMGLQRQVLLTGDRDGVAQSIGAELGIADVVAGALPEQKMARVLAEVAAGFRPMVVGDGINDSLALKAGAVGVAMGAQGTDVALASADLVLMTSDLRRLGTAIRLSRRCRRTIHVNVAVGLGWTLLLVGLAAAGVLGAEGAILAALLHNLSTFVGLGNAGRLLLFDETGTAAG